MVNQRPSSELLLLNQRKSLWTLNIRNAITHLFLRATIGAVLMALNMASFPESKMGGMQEIRGLVQYRCKLFDAMVKRNRLIKNKRSKLV